MSLRFAPLSPAHECIQPVIVDASGLDGLFDLTISTSKGTEVTFTTSSTSLISPSTASVSFNDYVGSPFPSSGTFSSLDSGSSSENASRGTNLKSALKKGRFSSQSVDSYGDNAGFERGSKSEQKQNKVKSRVAKNLSDLYTMKLYDECMTCKVKAHNKKLYKELMAKMKDDSSSEKGSRFKILKEVDISEELKLSSTTSTRSQSSTNLTPYQSSLKGLTTEDQITEHGQVFARYAGASFVMHQRWKSRYWAKVGPSTILIFRNENEFQDWKQNKKRKLVRKEINFDTVSVLQQSLSDGTNNTKASRAIRIFKYKMDSSKEERCNARMPKRNKNDMNTVTSFKLQMDTDAGIYPAASFASKDVKELDDLRLAILNCMEYCIQKYMKSCTKRDNKGFQKNQKKGR